MLLILPGAERWPFTQPHRGAGGHPSIVCVTQQTPYVGATPGCEVECCVSYKRVFLYSDISCSLNVVLSQPILTLQTNFIITSAYYFSILPIS